MTVDPMQMLIAGIRQGTRAAHVFFDQIPQIVGPSEVGLVRMQVCPEPLDPAWLEQPIEHAWGWPTVREDLSRHTGHVLLTCPEPGDTPVLEQMFQMSQVAGRVLEWPGAFAYLWVEGGVLHRGEVVQSLLSELGSAEGVLPIDLWMGVRLFREEDGSRVLLDTLGLQSFERRDLEIHIDLSPEAPGPLDSVIESMQEVLRHSALYLVLRGAEMVGDRHQLEFPDGSAYVMSGVASSLFPSRDVWQLVSLTSEGGGA